MVPLQKSKHLLSMYKRLKSLSLTVYNFPKEGPLQKHLQPAMRAASSGVARRFGLPVLQPEAKYQRASVGEVRGHWPA